MFRVCLHKRLHDGLDIMRSVWHLDAGWLRQWYNCLRFNLRSHFFQSLAKYVAEVRFRNELYMHFQMIRHDFTSGQILHWNVHPGHVCTYVKSATEIHSVWRTKGDFSVIYAIFRWNKSNGLLWSVERSNVLRSALRTGNCGQRLAIYRAHPVRGANGGFVCGQIWRAQRIVVDGRNRSKLENCIGKLAKHY